MDDTDAEILRLLAADGRLTLEEVAQRVGLRRPSVHARVRKLEAEGVIRGYAARLDPDALGGGLLAFVFVKVSHGKGQDCATACGKLAEAVRAMPQVLEYHTLAGDDDALLKVRARDVRDLEEVVMRRISGAPGVERVRTSVALSTHVERTFAPPPRLAVRARRP